MTEETQDRHRRTGLPALPTTAKGWDEIRKTTAQPKLIDYVEHAFKAAVDDPEYNGRLVDLISAPNNRLSVEGSVAFDKCCAAEIVRAKAVAIGLPLENVKAQVIANKMSSMLRRFAGASRSERRALLG